MSLEEKVMGLLHEKIGFNPESIGSSKVLASIRDSLRKKRIGDPEAFLSGLRSGNDEFHEIVNAVVIPETWFFRDGGPFEFLKRHVAAQRMPAPGGVLRCLSVPCSTGEEPYSIAMTLLDAGLTAQQFSIDAVDVSSTSLERAANGLYNQYSFRAENLDFRERYFERQGNGYKLKPSVRSTVRFSRANLLDPAFIYGREQYDVVFCRNLLIYFDETAWNQATLALQQLLKDSGLLFMGHAELLDLRSKIFESIRVPLTFAFRKRIEKTPAPAALRAPSQKSTKVPVKRADPEKPRRAKMRTPPKAESSASDTKPLDKLLDEATQLADQGQFARAGEICKRCLAENPASARSYFLLGLIAEVQDKNAEAEEQYRRTLYLDSQHQEAMVHLALLLEARGDPAAATLRQRASSVRQKT
jgi:chemotaxis protein methyltransferase WspC